jgi:hypothetical protein
MKENGKIGKRIMNALHISNIRTLAQMSLLKETPIVKKR